MEINRNESLTVGTTPIIASIEKFNANITRKSIIIINTSTDSQKITISIDKPAVSGQGIVLYAGGSWQDSAEDKYLPTQLLITAVSDAVGGTIAIQERCV